VCAAVACVVLAAPSYAYDFTDFFGEAPSYKRSGKKVVRQRAPEVRAYVKREDGKKAPQCLTSMRGVGTQWPTEAGAEDAAKKDWMETVRYDHGEKYMSIEQAQDYRHACSRSSIGDVAGQVFYRCEVTARPCRAPAVESEK
jgi:hypothetical protein